jgi:hypothetical protein
MDGAAATLPAVRALTMLAVNAAVAITPTTVALRIICALPVCPSCVPFLEREALSADKRWQTPVPRRCRLAGRAVPAAGPSKERAESGRVAAAAIMFREGEKQQTGSVRR